MPSHRLTFYGAAVLFCSFAIRHNCARISCKVLSILPIFPSNFLSRRSMAPSSLNRPLSKLFPPSLRPIDLPAVAALVGELVGRCSNGGRSLSDDRDLADGAVPPLATDVSASSSSSSSSPSSSSSSSCLKRNECKHKMTIFNHNFMYKRRFFKRISIENRHFRTSSSITTEPNKLNHSDVADLATPNLLRFMNPRKNF